MAAGFFAAELTRTQAWADRALPADERDGGDPRFVRAGAELYPPIRADMQAYGQRHGLKLHDMVNHLLSSQAFCFNMMGPFLHRPSALADLLRPLIGKGATPIWLPGEQGFVAFEYISGPDYLNESSRGPRQRGANCTSVNAAVGFVREGRRELLLIEWKLGESYGGALPNKAYRPKPGGAVDSNDARRRSYAAPFARGVIKEALALDAFSSSPSTNCCGSRCSPRRSRPMNNRALTARRWRMSRRPRTSR